MADNNSFKILGEAIRVMNESIGKTFANVSMPSSIMPKGYFTLDSPDLKLIAATRNPLIDLNEALLAETKKLNLSIDAMNLKIRELEDKAAKSEKRNVRRQWTIAIVSTLIGVVIGGLMTVFGPLVIAGL